MKKMKSDTDQSKQKRTKLRRFAYCFLVIFFVSLIVRFFSAVTRDSNLSSNVLEALNYSILFSMMGYISLLAYYKKKKGRWL